MLHKEKNASVSERITALFLMASVVIVEKGYTLNDHWYWGLLITLPLLLVAILDIRNTKHPG